MKSAHYFFTNLAHRQTDRQTNITDHITSLAEVITVDFVISVKAEFMRSGRFVCHSFCLSLTMSVGVQDYCKTNQPMRETKDFRINIY